MASHDGGIPDWIPIGISLLALAGTLGNYLLTLSRGRKRVHIQTSIGGRGAAKVRCRVTNTGYIRLQVQSVRIRATIDGRTGILLSLPNGETPRKLEQGESQVWEIDWERLLNSLEREKPQVRVTALV